MTRSLRCVAALAFAVILCSPQLSLGDNVWNAALQYTGTNQNPSAGGIWSYDVGGSIVNNGMGYSQNWTPNVATYVPMQFQTGPVDATEGYWQDGTNNPPWIYANNTTPSDANYPYDRMSSHPGTLPGNPVSPVNGIADALIWTSPISGMVNVFFEINTVFPQNAAGIQWAVYDGTTNQLFSNIGNTLNGDSGPQQSAAFPVSIGDKIYTLPMN